MAATLGAPTWKDPERCQSIKQDTRIKMEWRVSAPFSPMICWIALPPARPCLTDVMDQIEALFEKRNRDFWDGETTAPGCVWDRSMHGRSINDAQPTIIFSSLSKTCRRNARSIISEENIQVDRRGIGMEYYNTGPDFFAGNNRSGVPSPPLDDGHDSAVRGSQSASYSPLKAPSQPISRTRQNSFAASRGDIPIRKLPEIVGTTIRIGAKDCTMGGIIAIDGKLYALTVAHAFEDEREVTPDTGINKSVTTLVSGEPVSVGVLHEKRKFENRQGSRKNFDWALCVVNIRKVRISNTFHLPDGSDVISGGIMLGSPSDSSVWVHTGTGTVKGFMMADHSLVALPGSKTFQRMWIVILDRQIRNGDCGSWVTSLIGDWIGYVVAGKPGTEVAYVVLAKDAIMDIYSQLGGCNVTLPTEVDFVAAIVSSTKNDLSRWQHPDEGELPGPQSRSNLNTVSSSSSLYHREGDIFRNFGSSPSLEMEETSDSPYAPIELGTENDTLLAGCASREGIYPNRWSFAKMSTFILSYLSAVGSVAILLLAIYTGSSESGYRRWNLSGHGSLIVFIATIVELLSALAFASFVGQIYSRQMIAKGRGAGSTLAEMAQKHIVLQPFSVFRNSLRLERPILLTLLSVVVALFSTSYSTAAISLIAPNKPHYFRLETPSKGYVQSSYANLEYLTKGCRGMNLLGDNSVDCLKVDFSRRAPQDYIAFTKDWANGTSGFTRDWPLHSDRPRGIVTLSGKFSAQGSWVELHDIALNSAKFGRIIDNVSLAMPHPSVIEPGLRARSDAHFTEWSAGPASSDPQFKFDYYASVLSPTVNVLCANMAPKDLSPQVYSLWPEAKLTSSTRLGVEVPWDGWQTEVPVISDGEWLNWTTVDDVFKWGRKYDRRPPIFPMLPPDSHAILNSSMYDGDSLYILTKSPEVENYTMCSLRSYPREGCETRFTPLDDKPGFLETFCWGESISPPDDDYSKDWREVAALWAEALFPSIGVHNVTIANAEFLTQLIPTAPLLNTKVPSIAEALAALSACTLIDSSIDSPLAYAIQQNGSFILDDGISQSINASIPFQILSWRYNSPWSWLPCLFILCWTAFMNSCCLLYFVVTGNMVTDFTEPQNLFALAINSPPSERMKGACGGGPSEEQMHVKWQVTLDENTGHYQIEGQPVKRLRWSSVEPWSRVWQALTRGVRDLSR